MPHTVTREWAPDATTASSDPRLLTPFTYEAHVPDPIAVIDPTLPMSATQFLAEADAAVRELNADLRNIAGLESLARQLLRQESVASSRIEGLVMSHRRLAKAAIADDRQHRDTNAESILANIAAMEYAINTTAAEPSLTRRSLTEVHRVLMETTRDAHIAGIVRTSQNWIGGNSVNPRGAAFVPPPAELVGELLDDLAAFLNRTDLSPTLQAALAHVQFETIHAFADGNGRVGRCLVHVVYRRSEIAQRFVPPISLVLATDGDAYVNGLTAFRNGDAGEWYLTFAATVIKACRAARQLATEIDALEAAWLEQAGSPRQGSTARAIIRMLPAQPLFRSSHVMQHTGAGRAAADRAIARLADAGVIKQITVGQRYRAWEGVGLLALIDAFERRLATPDLGEGKPTRDAPFLH